MVQSLVTVRSLLYIWAYSVLCSHYISCSFCFLFAYVAPMTFAYFSDLDCAVALEVYLLCRFKWNHTFASSSVHDSCHFVSPFCSCLGFTVCKVEGKKGIKDNLTYIRDSVEITFYLICKKLLETPDIYYKIVYHSKKINPVWVGLKCKVKGICPVTAPVFHLPLISPEFLLSESWRSSWWHVL